MAKNLEGVVCLNHPNTPAVARCAACGKPICADCMKTKNNITCCSDRCLVNAIESGAVVSDIMGRKKKSEAKGLVAKIIKIVVVLLIIACLFGFKDKLMSLFHQAKDKTATLTEQAQGKVQEGINAIDKKGKDWDAKVRKKSTDDRMRIPD